MPNAAQPSLNCNADLDLWKDHPAVLADPELRELLKRCSPATVEAALKFRRSRELVYLPQIVVGVIERYVERDLRPRLANADPELRLVEDLSVDSLTMMEIVLLAEDVLQISINNDELLHLRTLGDVQRFVEMKVRGVPAAPSFVR
jgi:3-hydroxyacyl-[acyl-carrier-protein] dehydratase